MESIVYNNGDLKIIDQLLLPTSLEYISIRNSLDAWKAIKLMQIRGAPAIAILGGLSVAVELMEWECCSGKGDDGVKGMGMEDLVAFVREKLDHLVTSRPTAVNLANLRLDVIAFIDKHQVHLDCNSLKLKLIEKLEDYLKKDLECNHQIGNHGYHAMSTLPSLKLNLLTHCNTGALATAGFGTALGVVRKVHSSERLACCYFTETRPYNQGSRLTAYELIHDKIPSTMICDSMVASLMTLKQIDAVVVGADCVAANGDTANKIGTCQLAIVAGYYKVPFYVAAPTTSINLKIAGGEEIKIEERPPKEMTTISGNPTSVEGVQCWNPAFDVTPHHLITAIITEKGVFKPQELSSQLKNLSI